MFIATAMTGRVSGSHGRIENTR